MVYDGGRDRVVAFGGYFRGRAYDETLVLEGTEWVRRETEAPAARMSPGLCYDPQTRVVLSAESDSGQQRVRPTRTSHCSAAQTATALH